MKTMEMHNHGAAVIDADSLALQTQDSLARQAHHCLARQALLPPVILHCPPHAFITDRRADELCQP